MNIEDVFMLASKLKFFDREKFSPLNFARFYYRLFWENFQAKL